MAIFNKERLLHDKFLTEKVIIEKIEIKNYRLCKHAVFKPNEALSILIGPNGSGKTTILRSILLLKELANAYPRYIEENLFQGDPTILNVHLKVGEHKIIHSISAYLDNNEENEDKILSVHEKWSFYSLTGSRKWYNFPLASVADIDFLYKTTNRERDLFYHSRRSGRLKRTKRYDLEVLAENKKVGDILLSISDFYAGITYYSASKFTNPSLCPISFQNDDDVKYFTRGRRNGHLAWLSDMYSEDKAKSESYSSYLEIIGKKGIGLIDKLNFLEVEISNIKYSVKTGGEYQSKQKKEWLIIPQFHIQGSVLSPSQLSEGTFKTLGILFYIITGKGSLILLEEPEVCIHHGLLNSILELIKNYSSEKQILISTHSDYILDSINPSAVHVVKREKTNGITVTSLNSYLSKTDKNALKNFLSLEGSLGEYWRMGAIDD